MNPSSIGIIRLASGFFSAFDLDSFPRRRGRSSSHEGATRRGHLVVESGAGTGFALGARLLGTFHVPSGPVKSEECVACGLGGMGGTLHVSLRCHCHGSLKYNSCR